MYANAANGLCADTAWVEPTTRKSEKRAETKEENDENRVFIEANAESQTVTQLTKKLHSKICQESFTKGNASECRVPNEKKNDKRTKIFFLVK